MYRVKETHFKMHIIYRGDLLHAMGVIDITVNT